MINVDGDSLMKVQAEYLTNKAIQSEDAYKMYKTALDLQCYPKSEQLSNCIKRLEEAVTLNKDPRCIIIRFAKDIHESDIERIGNQLMALGKMSYAHILLNEVEGADVLVPKFQQMVLEAKNAEYACSLAIRFKNVDVSALQQVVVDSKDAKYAYIFAKYVKGADVQALQKAVIDSKDAEYAYEFAQDIEGADMQALQKAVIDSKDAKYAYLFAKDIEGADIKALQQTVIESKDAGYACYFAIDIKGVDIPALQKVVVESKDTYSAKRFSTFVKRGTYAKQKLFNNFVVDRLKQHTR